VPNIGPKTSGVPSNRNGGSTRFCGEIAAMSTRLWANAQIAGRKACLAGSEPLIYSTKGPPIQHPPFGVATDRHMGSEKQRPDRIDPTSVPKVVVSRLSLYLRELQHLVRDGRDTTSSNQLGQLLGFTDAQVRKDLAYFGHFGHPGVGYRCEELIAEIRRILGTDREWIVTMVGVGNLGRALLRYKGFAAQGFRIVAAFDADARVVGSTIEGISVHSLDRLPEIVRQRHIQIGMVTVPAPAAQQVADQLVAAGIAGIVNFAPVTLSLPPEVSVVGVDLATELEQIAFSVANRTKSC